MNETGPARQTASRGKEGMNGPLRRLLQTTNAKRIEGVIVLPAMMTGTTGGIYVRMTTMSITVKTGPGAPL